MMDVQPAGTSRPWQTYDMACATPPRAIGSSGETPSRETRDAVHGGRVATPRWPYFRSADMSMDMCDATEDMTSERSTTWQIEWNHRASLRRRRLPSPIREDRCVSSPSPSPTTLAGVSLEGSKLLNAQGYNTTMMEDRKKPRNPPAWNAKSSRMSTGGGKTMLSMGYRADCEKCRTRVPGHYNHVIRI